MRLRTVAAALPVVVATVALGVPSGVRAGPPPTPPVPPGRERPVLPRPPLRPEGRWLKDATGRTVIVHGLELARKTPPYHAPPESFTERDARNLEAWGFDAVRLAWFWKGLEPQRGRIDRDYVAEIAREGALLARHHVFTLLEAHQDGYNETLGGAGFPDWATTPPTGGAGGGLLGEASWSSFENLYANTDGIGDAFARAWRVMAAAFRSNPRMLGYDLLNEPGAGTASATCLLQPDGCPELDRNVLQPFQDRVVAAIRDVDPTTIAFYEPNIFFDVGAPSALARPPAASGPSGFAFHDYCLVRFVAPRPDHDSEAPGYETCEALDERVFANALATAASMGVPPLFGEFGDTQDLTDIARTIRLADEHLTGWIYWGYKDWADIPGGQGSGPLFDDSDHDGTLRRDKLALLAQPYAMATAGTPLSSGYDVPSDTLAYEYAPDPTVAAPTVVFTSPLLHPAGYTASVQGGHVTSRPDAPYLEVRADPGAARVSVRVVGRPAPRAAPAPASTPAPTPGGPLSWMTSEAPALDPVAAVTGSCGPRADAPTQVALPRTPGPPAVARLQTSGGAGEATNADGISIAYGSGDSSWLDLGSGPPARAAAVELLCRAGTTRFDLVAAPLPSLPATFSGRSTRAGNVSLAASRLAFRVPRPGRYVADVTVDGGGIQLGLRRADGSTAPAQTFPGAGVADLGVLRPGRASLDVVPLAGPQVSWTVTVRPVGPPSRR